MRKFKEILSSILKKGVIKWLEEKENKGCLTDKICTV